MFPENHPFIAKYYRIPYSDIADIIHEHATLIPSPAIALKHGVSASTAGRLFRMADPCSPRLNEAISIDEFKGNSAGAKFQAVINSLTSKRCLDILPDRSADKLYESILQYPLKERLKVKYVSNKGLLQFPRVDGGGVGSAIFHFRERHEWFCGRRGLISCRVFSRVDFPRQNSYNEGGRRYFLKYLKQFGIILIFSFVGELLNRTLPLPLPPSIYGIAVMFLCLAAGVVRVSDVKETSALMIEIMPVMFIPPAVGLMETWPMMRNDWPAYLIITVSSTFIVMGAAGRVTQWALRSGGRGKGGRDDG